MQDEQWDEVINTNLRGAFLFTPGRDAADDAGPLRADHQHRQRVGADGQPGPVELLGLEGRF